MSGSVFAAHLLTRLQDLNLRGDFYFDQELFALCEPLQSADQRILFLHKYYDMAQDDSIEAAEQAFLEDYFGKQLVSAKEASFDPEALLNSNYQVTSNTHRNNQNVEQNHLEINELSNNGDNHDPDAQLDAILDKMLTDSDQLVSQDGAGQATTPSSDDIEQGKDNLEAEFAKMMTSDVDGETEQDIALSTNQENDLAKNDDDPDTRFDAALAKLLTPAVSESSVIENEPEYSDEINDNNQVDPDTVITSQQNQADDPDVLLDINDDEDFLEEEDDGFFIAGEDSLAKEQPKEYDDPDDRFDNKLAQMMSLSNDKTETTSEPNWEDEIDDDDDEDNFFDEIEDDVLPTSQEFDPFDILGKFETELKELDQGRKFITKFANKLQPLPEDFSWQQQILRPLIIANPQLELIKLQLDQAVPLYLRLAGELAIVLVNDQLQYLTSAHVDEEFLLADYLNQAREALYQHIDEFHFETISPGVYHLDHIEQHSTALSLFGYKLFKRCQLKGEPVIMMPDQHNLLITGSENIDGLQFLIGQAQNVVESESADLISPEIFHFMNNRLQLFHIDNNELRQPLADLRAAYHYAFMSAQAEFIHKLCDAEIKVDRLQFRVQENNSNESNCFTATGVHAFTFKLKEKILLPRVDYLTLAHFIDNQTQAITVAWRDVALACGKLFKPIPELNEWYELTTMPDEKQWQRLLAKASQNNL